MATMLIVNAVIILGIASESHLAAASSSSSTIDNPLIDNRTTTKTNREFINPPASIVWSANSKNRYGKRYIVPYSSSSASYEDNSQAGTTLKTIPVSNPTQSVTYNPGRNNEENVQRQDPRGGPSANGETSRTIVSLPTLQGGFRASPEDGYPKNSPSFATQPNHRFLNKFSNGNQNSQYFTNPGSYRFLPETKKVAPSVRTTSFSNSVGFSPLQKFETSPFANNRYPANVRDHSLETLPKLRFGPSSNFNGPIVNFGQPSKGSYRSSYPVSKNLDVTSPAFSSGISNDPGFKDFDNLANNYQYGSLPTVGNKNVALPISLQLKNNPEIGFVRAFDNEPVILSTGINYQTRPSSGLNFDFSKASPTSLPDENLPFSSTIGNYRSPILPIHSSSVAPHISQYKNSNANAFPSNEYAKTENGYQLLANQPQLHFANGTPLKGGRDRQNVIYHSKPFDEIRTDVEVIDKKKSTTPKPDDSDENDFDEDFKTSGREFGHFPVENGDDSRPNKSPERERNFDVPNSNLFHSYDEAFGKYSKLASREKNTNGKIRPVAHQDSKPVYQSIEEEDDGNRDKSSEEYRSSYTEGEAGNSSYEDEDEQESRRSEKQGSDGESSEENREEDDDETASYKSYGEDYEKEFEDSYKKELPKNNYVHVKEVPEIEESTSESKKRPATRNRPKTSRGGSKQKSRHVVQEENEEPKEYESYTSHDYERPRSNYRDNEGHGSRISSKTTTSSEPPIADSYGYKIPRERGPSRNKKKENSESTSIRDEPTKSRASSDKRSTKFSRENSSTQKPVTLTLPTFDSIESYTFPPFIRQKSIIKSPRATDSYGEPTYAVQAFSNPQVHREDLRYFENGEITRDLRGI